MGCILLWPQCIGMMLIITSRMRLPEDTIAAVRVYPVYWLLRRLTARISRETPTRGADEFNPEID
jgi:hypothetical protein